MNRFSSGSLSVIWFIYFYSRIYYTLKMETVVKNYLYFSLNLTTVMTSNYIISFPFFFLSFVFFNSYWYFKILSMPFSCIFKWCNVSYINIMLFHYNDLNFTLTKKMKVLLFFPLYFCYKIIKKKMKIGGKFFFCLFVCLGNASKTDQNENLQRKDISNLCNAMYMCECFFCTWFVYERSE